MNFMFGTQLAIFQDELTSRYYRDNMLKIDKNVTQDEIVKLQKNLWVFVANFLAPSNLTLRQHCLVSIITRKTNQALIAKQLNLLAPNDLFVEGYSYWLYTKKILLMYVKEFKNESIKLKIKTIDDNFLKSSYVGSDNKLYPAPFGDLRDEPLEDSLQRPLEMFENVTVAFVMKIGGQYRINPCYIVQAHPLGLNTHAPKVDHKNVLIENNRPKNFKWYEGYDKKYKNVWAEIVDMFSIRRILSI